ncbi:hypothetical protein EDD76_11034 [Kineothrix alysoides]|uniref:4Fe-4S ferredoxin-type domain-containing protein n=1 Tax=Kineothrix alysoides TaxID=1469948 RepID=A0A4V2QBL7_9FIRM|nr:EFR1 family ferrodoxin [Kineothrix alysoides]TCL56862.1 hypothetical protein EDD76_11034 [Kineothrix alysoides]
MSNRNIPFQDITLAYFSGTGCTKAAVSCFESRLAGLGIHTSTICISSDSSGSVGTSDLLIVFSPVYAFRLTSIVEDWVKRLPDAQNTYAAIISVSGGGEISPNTACRTLCKRILIRKGYHFVYENMLVMPSNFASHAGAQLNKQLIDSLPKKAAQMIDDILSGKKNNTHPKFQDRLFASIGKAEHLGAKFFGAFIRTSSHCNQCGLCIKSCPKRNIRMKEGKPAFGFHCMLCLRCIYACPQKALSPGILKFFVLKEGFDLKAMSKAPDPGKDQNVQEYSAAEQLLWKGVLDYLE